MSRANPNPIMQPSDDLREIRRLQPLIHAATVTASNSRRATSASEAADTHLDGLLSELAVVQERVYGRPPVCWMDIVERAELAVAWCWTTTRHPVFATLPPRRNRTRGPCLNSSTPC